MEFKKEKDYLIVKIPLKQKINNLYVTEGDLHYTDNLIGVIADGEYTISNLIDLDYKDDQQEGMPILFFNTREELEKACKIGNINIWEYPICAYCGKAIRGYFTYSKKGNQCYNCEKEKRKSMI